MPGARSTRDGDTGNEDNSRFYAMFSLVLCHVQFCIKWLKIIITLRRAQKFGDTGPFKNFDFLFNRLTAAVFFPKRFFTMFMHSRRITVNA